eukprot:5682283-Amphidinium_carterae.1
MADEEEDVSYWWKIAQDDPGVLCRAPEMLLNQRGFVLHAVRSQQDALNSVPLHHENSTSWTPQKQPCNNQYRWCRLLTLRTLSDAFRHVQVRCPRWLADTQILLEAISQNGENLRFAPGEEDKKPLVLAALNLREKRAWGRTGQSPLHYVSDGLKHDIDVVQKAITIDCTAWASVPYKLQRDRTCLFTLLKGCTCGKMLLHIDDTFRADPEIVRAAATKKVESLNDASADVAVGIISQGHHELHSLLQNHCATIVHEDALSMHDRTCVFIAEGELPALAQK